MNDRCDEEEQEIASNIDLGEADDDNSGTCLFANRFLPSGEAGVILEESKRLENDLMESLERLQVELSSQHNLTAKTVGKTMKLINKRIALKFFFSVQLRTHIVQAMLTLFHDKEKASIVIRTKAVNVITIMMNKKWEKLSVTIDWVPFWMELKELVMRENRHSIFGTETVLVQFIAKLSNFLHKCRSYFDLLGGICQTEPRGLVYVKAMACLQDLRSPQCVEGVLLLMNCLPSKWKYYDAVLSDWFELWSQFSQNSTWDLCWAVVMSRAVKYCSDFNWEARLPFLLSKIRDLLQLPDARKESSGHVFPKAFPAYYAFFFSYLKDPMQHCLWKLSKIVARIVTVRGATAVFLDELSIITVPSVVEDVLANRNLEIVGFNKGDVECTGGLKVLVSFLHTLRPYIHPSNNGQHTVNIALFLSLLARTIGQVVGEAIGDKLGKVRPSAVLSRSSVLYLSGYLLSQALDGLYSKNMRVNRTFSMCLKHLIPLQPDIGHLVVAFCLQPLENGSVQSFQSVVSIMTLSNCMRAGLFPNALFLQYLTRILKASLPLVEISDGPRTIMALDLWATIFSWVCLSEGRKVRAPTFSSFMQLLDLTEDDNRSYCELSPALQTQYEEFLSFVLEDWIPAVMQKIFTLISSEEAKLEGVQDSPVSSAVHYFVSILFQAMECVGERFVLLIRENIVRFVITTAPAHTDKSCAKLLEYFIGQFPCEAENVVVALLSEDVKSGVMSADRLAFRIRTIGGCFRQSNGVACYGAFSAVSDLLVNPALLYHDDAKVRKSVWKLSKDILKGTCSVYPVHVYPQLDGNGGISAPNIVQDKDVRWYEPNEDALRWSIKISRETLLFCDSQIQRALDTSGGGDLSAKKREDLLSSSLALIQYILRGLAEIISESAELFSASYVSTGRERALSSLDEEDQSFILHLRSRIMTLLMTIHVQVHQSSSSQLGLLQNSETLAKYWMAVVEVILLRRVAFCKDVDKLKKWVDISTSQTRIALCSTVFKRLKEVGKCGWTEGKLLRDESIWNSLSSGYYWRRHDWNMNALCGFFWLQHCTRAVEFGRSSLNCLIRNTSFKDTDDLTTQVINALLSLTYHSYDEIRPAARKTLETLSHYFGWKLNEIIASLLSLLRQSDLSYQQAASTLVILKQSAMMRRIQSDIDLKCHYLQAISAVPVIANNIVEEDKREKLMSALSESFIKYSQGWSVVPKDLVLLKERVLPHILRSLGALSSTDAEMRQSLGLRVDSIHTYVLLHCLDLSIFEDADGEVFDAVVHFLLNQLCEKHGQPSQVLSYSGLCRIVDIVCRLTSVDREGRDWCVTLKHSFDPSFNENRWKDLSMGLLRVAVLSRGLGTGERDQNTWSKGVQELLNSAGFLSIVKSRHEYHLRCEHNFYSNMFRYDSAALWQSMLSSGLIPWSSCTVSNITVLDYVLKTTLQDLQSRVGDNEKRAVNVITSELFGGALRHVLSLPSADDILLEWFISFLQDQIKDLSVDFVRDWQEAVYYGLETAATSDRLVLSPLILSFLDSFSAVVKHDASPTSADNSQDESFSKLDKPIMLTTAAIQALAVAQWHRGWLQSQSRHSNLLSQRVAEILLLPNASIILPYRSSRQELSALLVTLMETVDESILKRLCHKICEGSYSEEDTHRRNTIETVCLLLGRLANRVQSHLLESVLSSALTILAAGISDVKTETVKMATECLFTSVLYLRPTHTVSAHSFAGAIIPSISELTMHSCWRVREAMTKALTVFMNTNWTSLSNDQRLLLRDACLSGMKDSVVEVQEASRNGMISYLAFKSDKELRIVAEAYTRNSEALAAREKAKRRLLRTEEMTNAVGKVDEVHLNMIHLIACVILSRPYDVPIFIPPLLESFLRHKFYDETSSVLSKCVQLFKRTHQDRWEDLQKRFNADQLHGLQGAGAAHYFA